MELNKDISGLVINELIKGATHQRGQERLGSILGKNWLGLDRWCQCPCQVRRYVLGNPIGVEDRRRHRISPSLRVGNDESTLDIGSKMHLLACRRVIRSIDGQKGYLIFVLFGKGHKRLHKASPFLAFVKEDLS